MIDIKDRKVAIAITGGGTMLIPELLKYGGASNYIVDISIPYSRSSLDSYIGRGYDKACHETTAKSMAKKALSISGDVGIGITASLKKEQQREDRMNHAYICIATKSGTVDEHEFIFDNNYTRLKQEELLSEELYRYIENFFSQSRFEVNLDLKNRIAKCLSQKSNIYIPINSEKQSNTIYPGSFNPFHKGHNSVIDHFCKENNQDFVDLEICVNNVDKQCIGLFEIVNRLQQKFPKNIGGVWITHLPLFIDKIKFFNSTARFLVGADTYIRICDVKYSNINNDKIIKDANIYIFGRNNLTLPANYLNLRHIYMYTFKEVDISSTELRGNNE